MTSKQAVVYYCDEPGCTEIHIGRPTTWWLSRGDHKCPAHRPTCTRCGARLRNQGKSLEEVPNSVRTGWNGMCNTCAVAMKRAQHVDAIDEVSPQEIRYVRRLIADRLDNPDDRNLILDLLKIGDDV